MDSILLDVRGTQSAADCRPPALRSRPSFTRVVCRPANITRCRVSVSGLERLLGRHACNATVRGGVAYPYVARRPEQGKQTSWDCGLWLSRGTSFADHTGDTKWSSVPIEEAYVFFNNNLWNLF